MAYVITNPRYCVVRCPKTGIQFEHGKRKISDEEFQRVVGSKVLLLALKTGLLGHERLEDPKAKGKPEPSKPATKAKG